MFSLKLAFGSYDMSRNDDIKGVTIYRENRKIVDIADIAWWDKDGIESWMYAHQYLIKEKESGR